MQTASLVTFASREMVRGPLLRQAMKEGIFRVKMPKYAQEQLNRAVAFGLSFPSNPTYTERKFQDFTGYFEAPGNQTRSFVAIREKWDEVFPEEVVPFAKTLYELGRFCYERMMRELGVSEERADVLTGGATAGKGITVCSFHHYDPTIESKDGLKEHRDFGGFTILCNSGPGLELYRDGKWMEVEHSSEHFLLMFGEQGALTNLDKIEAPLHRVRSVGEKRVAAGVFFSPKMDDPVYRCNEGELEEIFPKYAELWGQLEKGFRLDYRLHERKTSPAL